MKRILLQYVKCFTVLIMFFSLSMILVYQIPNSALRKQYDKSVEQIGKEDVYANFLFNSDASIMDNFTDKLLLDTSMISENYKNRLEPAFDNNGYPRYWNGYLITLRPFLTQFSYQQIRYINMILLVIMFAFCFSDIRYEFGSIMAFGFAVSIVMCFLIFIGESLQYFSVFLILFTEIVLFCHDFKIPFLKNNGILLFGAGMIVNFFDMLTAPLLTLGIPLILMISRRVRKEEYYSLRKMFLDIFCLSLSWCAGYALCWITKWTAASVVLGKNVFAEAFKTAVFRVSGNEMFPLDRVMMLKMNIETYYFAKGRKPFIIIIAAIAASAAVRIWSHRNNWDYIVTGTLSVGLFPYVWFLIFSNHSQLHYFFTYRIQAITLFAVFAAVSNTGKNKILT